VVTLYSSSRLLILLGGLDGLPLLELLLEEEEYKVKDDTIGNCEGIAYSS